MTQEQRNIVASEAGYADAMAAPLGWHCNTHGTIHDAKWRTWDNGDADPLHSTMEEWYCPRCGIECLTVEEWEEERAA